MSTKTLRKRISLVAVSALGAGLLSVVAVPSAYAATATLATTNAAAASTTIGSETSVGLITSSTAGGSALTGTATLLSTGTLVVKGVSAAGTDYVAMQVTGGTISAATAETTAGAHTTNITNTYIYSNTADKDLSVAFRFASGSTSMTIAVYTNAAASTTSGTLSAQWVVTSATSSSAGTYSASASKVNIVNAALAGDISRVTVLTMQMVL